jgi:hypothetical protein
MSSVVISGDTSGSVTLQAPAVAGTTVLTLPATSGTVITGAGGVTAVTAGGTGAATLTANNVILGNGTSAVQFVAPGTNGNLLTSNGTTWTSVAPPSSTPTTAQVQSAMAGSSQNDLGTYNLGYISNGSVISAGTNYAGSSINMSGIYTDSGTWPGSPIRGGAGAVTVSGTWKALAGISSAGALQRAVLFLRVA